MIYLRNGIFCVLKTAQIVAETCNAQYIFVFLLILKLLFDIIPAHLLLRFDFYMPVFILLFLLSRIIYTYINFLNI